MEFFLVKYLISTLQANVQRGGRRLSVIHPRFQKWTFQWSCEVIECAIPRRIPGPKWWLIPLDCSNKAPDVNTHLKRCYWGSDRRFYGLSSLQASIRGAKGELTDRVVATYTLSRSFYPLFGTNSRIEKKFSEIHSYIYHKWFYNSY